MLSSSLDPREEISWSGLNIKSAVRGTSPTARTAAKRTIINLRKCQTQQESSSKQKNCSSHPTTRHRNVNDSSMLQPETSLSNALDRVGFRCDAYWRGRMTKYPIEQALGTLIEIAVCSQRRQPCKCLSKVSAVTSSVKR